MLLYTPTLDLISSSGARLGSRLVVVEHRRASSARVIRISKGCRFFYKHTYLSHSYRIEYYSRTQQHQFSVPPRGATPAWGRGRGPESDWYQSREELIAAMVQGLFCFSPTQPSTEMLFFHHWWSCLFRRCSSENLLRRECMARPYFPSALSLRSVSSDDFPDSSQR